MQRETRLAGAVLARVASSHLRVGTFQYAAGTGDVDLVAAAGRPRDRPAPPVGSGGRRTRTSGCWRPSTAAQASLLARWMLVGFVHGVMNTDNMTISGETIDYGPCAFMDAFDPETVFSSIDQWGRYAYGNQPAIAEWNLTRLAECLLPLFSDDQDAGRSDRRGVAGHLPAAVRRRPVGRDARQTRPVRTGFG